MDLVAMSLVHQLRRKYEHVGFESLVKTSPSSIAAYLLLEHVVGSTDRDDMLTISARRNSKWHYGEQETIRITERPGRPIPEPFTPIAGQYSIEQPFVCELPNCKLIGDSAPLALSSSGRILLESTRSTNTEAMRRIKQQADSNGWFQTISNLSRQKTSRTETIGFPMVRPPHFGYYHWITEYLPKIKALEHYQHVAGEQPILLIENNPPSWVGDTLRLCGISSDRWTEWTGELTTFQKFVVPVHREKSRGKFFNPSVQDYNWVRNRLRSAVDSPSETDEFNENIYISRENAGHRRVLNRTDVMDELSPLGFESYRLEEMDLSSQIALFSQADTVVAPHGAGLVNLLFCSRPVRVLELQNANHLEPGPDLAYYYFALAHLFGYEYDFLSCEPVGDDMVVPTSKLKRAVTTGE